VRSLTFFRLLPVGSKLLRDWFQRGIKLHEAVFDCGVVLVALSARRLWIRDGGHVLAAELEVRPLVGESR
jgi:hypothetical protein